MRQNKKGAKMFLLLSLLQILLLTLNSKASLANANGHEIKYCDANQRENCPPKNVVRTVPEGCFRAAVYEHERKDLTRVQDSESHNLAVFQDVAKIAAQSGASIIVFPEDGIIYGTRPYLYPALVEIPDPEALTTENNNPCQTPILFESSILKNLSCIARDNNLYVVANFGTKQNCEPKSKVKDQICPDTGYFALNTNVVFDPSGAFIKRYRKFNMFLEAFDKAPSLEVTYFDTPMGRFGLFTCFDMLFKRPAIELVEKYNIDTALFPTFWYDELPLLSAIQIQDGWSWTNKVNLLAANIHKRYLGSIGSGIYSGYNALNTVPNDTNSRLMIATIPKKFTLESECPFEPQMINTDVENSEIFYDYKHYRLEETDKVYILDKIEGTKTVCTGQVCCSIDFKIKPLISNDELERLILVARDSVRHGSFEWYEQVCTISTLRSPINLNQITQSYFSMEGLASFERLKLKATFNTRYVYPIVAYHASELMPRKERDFRCDQLGTQQDNIVTCSLEYTGISYEKPIYQFGMYGRIYHKDQMPEGW